MSARWHAEQDVGVLAWARSQLGVRATDPLPVVVGPGHNGSPRQPDHPVVRHPAKFARALEVERRLRTPLMTLRCGLVKRDVPCERCTLIKLRDEPAEGARLWHDCPSNGPTTDATMADVLWFAHGLHGEHFANRGYGLEFHVGWAFASDTRRGNWARVKNPVMRDVYIASFGMVVLSLARDLFEDFDAYIRVYSELEGFLSGVPLHKATP